MSSTPKAPTSTPHPKPHHPHVSRLHRLRHHLRKPHVALTAAATLAACGGTVATNVAPPTPAPVAIVSTPSPAVSLATDDPNVAGTGCDPSFEKFTYHPARLVRLKDCVTVTGTVMVIRHEADGDLHVQFKLDPAFIGLMNAMNADTSNPITGGYFIIEPDCVGGPVSQADAQGPCMGAVAPPGFALLKVGAHLKVSGPWVTDSQHGHLEIHPIERIEA
jgi:hypothetical protein